jgi:flagellar basal-body rod protein FlgF
MDRAIHLSLNAMRLYSDNQRAITASLSNQNTVGFKRDLNEVLASAYLQHEGTQDRVFSTRGENSVAIDQGKLLPTGNSLDIALEGPGFLVGQKPNGDQVITRRGDLNVGSDRILRNSEGVTILGDAGAINVPPYSSIDIARDGTVQIQPQDALPGQPPVVVGRLRLVDVPAANIVKSEDGMMRPKDGVVPQANANVTIVPKSLESSNVDPIQSMVDMLGNTRHYEMSVKILNTMKDLDAETSKLMRTDR